MSAETPTMEAIEVSAEMLAFVGQGNPGAQPWPMNPVAFIIDISGYHEPPTFRFHGSPTHELLSESAELSRILLIVAKEACERLLGAQLTLECGRAYLLTADFRTIGVAIRDCDLPAAAALPYRLAKCIELLCEIIESERKQLLVPVVGDVGCTLSSNDRDRVACARMMIDERWSEPLTLEQIARHCGINRSKLSRGFRELYATSVAEALSERRLAQARLAILATDLPIGLIGYRSGYQNNASFTRAFGRRFGVSPSELRSGMVA
jgi:AraC family transcriptional activator of pyochelin receptor